MMKLFTVAELHALSVAVVSAGPSFQVRRTLQRVDRAEVTAPDAARLVGTARLRLFAPDRAEHMSDIGRDHDSAILAPVLD